LILKDFLRSEVSLLWSVCSCIKSLEDDIATALQPAQSDHRLTAVISGYLCW
jgi:hypothetical protein